jgi:hypothetical protein
MFTSKEDLAPTDVPLVWKFAIKASNRMTLWVGYDGCEAKTVDLDLSYCPALACFDIECCRAMLIPETSQDTLPLLKAQWKKKYMNDLRHAISREICTVDGRTLQDGSWKMGMLHQWCIRTWNTFSHSEFGCNQYLIRCREKKIIPYAQELSHESECFHGYAQPRGLKPGYRIRLDETF